MYLYGKNLSEYKGLDDKKEKKQYNECSKISNTSCLQKNLRQTEQTQIRLLLEK